MNASELITYCLIAGDVALNKQLTGGDGQLTDFYMIQMTYRGRSITFQYYKNGDDIIFIKGARTLASGLGTSIENIYGFKHLLKYLDIS